MRSEHFAQLDERAYDVNADLDGSVTVQDARSQDGPVFGKCIRPIAPSATSRFEVAVCDLKFLVSSELN